MAFLSLDDHNREVADLTRQFGAPLLRRARVGDAAYWASETRTRLAEVCMVVRRPGGRLLVCTKTFYPPGVYRLLTGGIDPGESVLAALHREVAEETGLQVAIRRLLAVITYYATEAGAGRADPARFAT